jgi:CheY-like chemotaxis protein
MVLALTANVLSDLGYAVTTAHSGSNALAILANGDPVDTLVTDVQMLGLNGALARSARGLRPTLAIRYCTGQSEMCAGLGLAFE